MLPNRRDSNFPAALKKRREELGLSLSELARLVGIHIVMPGRYENPNSTDFTAPSQKTWEKLNQVLFPDEQVNETKVVKTTDFTIEELVQMLKDKGAENISFTIKL